MSAFVVSKQHVAAIVQAYERTPYCEINERDRFASTPLHWTEALATMLFAENVRSVRHRYRDRTPQALVEFTISDIAGAPTLEPAAVLKLVDSLEYQSCECDDYRTTEAYKALDRIRGSIISILPGYQTAEWAL